MLVSDWSMFTFLEKEEKRGAFNLLNLLYLLHIFILIYFKYDFFVCV